MNIIRHPAQIAHTDAIFRIKCSQSMLPSSVSDGEVEWPRHRSPFYPSHSEVVLVQKGAAGAGCNPAARSAGWSRDADKKNRIATRAGCSAEVSRKLGIAMGVKRHLGRIEGSLIAAGVADQRASHRGDWPGGPAEDGAVNHESVDFPLHSSGRQIHAGEAASRGPGKRAAVNGADGIVNVQGGNYADNAFPAHEIVLACESWGKRQYAQDST